MTSLHISKSEMLPVSSSRWILAVDHNVRLGGEVVRAYSKFPLLFGGEYQQFFANSLQGCQYPKHCNNIFFFSVNSLYCLLKLRIICLKIVIYEYLRKNMIKKSNTLPYTHINYHMFISM